ncbi:MAG: hypothetical protein ABEJ05_14355 [Haloglomus sp.]
MRRLRIAAAVAALLGIHAWHALLRVARRESARSQPPGGDENPELLEHERGWYDYLRGFHAHHGDPESYGVPTTDGDGPEHGDLWHGLDAWWQSNCLRGYTLGDDVYICPGTPRVVWVHQAGHAPSFGRDVPTLVGERRENDGLPDEPLRTLDVMLPGRFPHTCCRLRDERGLRDRYDEWLDRGRIQRLSG